MSLFQFCPWWSAQCPDLGTNYDAYSMHSCRLGLADSEKDYIVVGSHTGFLSIYNPAVRPDEDETATEESADDGQFTASLDGASQATDLVLEIKLAHPIIGITSGRFIG